MSVMEVRLHAIRFEARGIHAFELRPMDGDSLPAFTAGSHIDLHLPNGCIRSYSLSNPPSERHRYVIGVNKAPDSRGASKYVHEKLQVGSTLGIGAPRNDFALHKEAAHSVFIAGGIGITPLRSMISRLEELGRSWELFYGCRDRGAAAFVEELQTLGERRGAKLHFSFDQAPGGQRMNLGEIVRQARGDAHLYCCGPLPMLTAFEEASAALERHRVHVEYFRSKEAPVVAGGFEVELTRSKRIIVVAPGQTILDALLAEGIDAPYACMEGVCGSCETRVLRGMPDHHDLVLSSDEREANDRMMICCSGSLRDCLVLDL